jgi:hypothetical protein
MNKFNVPTTMTRFGRLGAAGALELGLRWDVIPGMVDNYRNWWNKK